MASFGENAVLMLTNINMNSGQTIVNSRNMSSIDEMIVYR